MVHVVIYWPNEERVVEDSGLLSLPEHALHLLPTSAYLFFPYQLSVAVVFKLGMLSFLVFVYENTHLLEDRDPALFIYVFIGRTMQPVGS